MAKKRQTFDGKNGKKQLKIHKNRGIQENKFVGKTKHKIRGNLKKGEKIDRNRGKNSEKELKIKKNYKKPQQRNRDRKEMGRKQRKQAINFGKSKKLAKNVKNTRKK